MSEQKQRMCVLLPCASNRHWAVPQNCLAEILTLPASDDNVPAQVRWRGVDIPVIDLADGSDLSWRDENKGTGLIAVILGVRGAGPDYWGVALRGEGLSVRQLDADECDDRADAMQEYALAAFELDGQVYQVPDLPALQGLAMERSTAATA
jgi:hypothetical protein